MGKYVHGHSSRSSGKSPTLESWFSMKTRCLNKNRGDYKHYGGRGITICERWMTFNNFLADMGERPHNATLDRIDSNAGYGPENCRWAKKYEQTRNRVMTVKLTMNGLTKPMAEWSEILGISYSTLRSRKRYGWSDDQILSGKKVI